MKHIVFFSYGLGSYAAGKRVVQSQGVSNTLLLHTDTRYEDEDTYRWGVAAAAVLGAPLVKIEDGRDIWDVFRDERFLGNSRVDPCSKILKRQLARTWVEREYPNRDCVLVFGIHWSERDRFDTIKRRWEGWNVVAPLCEPPFVSYADLEREAYADGLWKQKLYADGFPHANCGGRCVKQGQAGWKLLLDTRPDRYRECEEKEQGMRDLLGKDVSIMRGMRHGKMYSLTLREFRENIERNGEYDRYDFGGCNCFGGEEP